MVRLVIEEMANGDRSFLHVLSALMVHVSKGSAEKIRRQVLKELFNKIVFFLPRGSQKEQVVKQYRI
jgi:hypothetical protein